MAWFRVRIQVNRRPNTRFSRTYYEMSPPSSQPHLGHRHHLHPPGSRMALPDRGFWTGIPATSSAGLLARPWTRFRVGAVDNALLQATPEIWNSDQGSHFTSPQYIQRLQQAGVQVSMDGTRARQRQHFHRTIVAHDQVRRSLPA